MSAVRRSVDSIRCGVSGWTYPEWIGTVFPKPRPRGFHALEYLSQFIDCIEVSSSFTRDIRPEDSRRWLRKVERNPGFRFSVVLHRRFTHGRNLEPHEISGFKSGLWPLMRSGRLACVLMQFPWGFTFTEENRRFFIALRRAFHEFPLVAEMGHPSWSVDEAVGVFIDHRVGYCNADQAQPARLPPPAILTGRVGYVRFHGPPPGAVLGDLTAAPEAERGSSYLYSAAELDAWSQSLLQLAAYCPNTFAVFCNSGHAASLVNCLQLRASLRSEAPTVPDRLVAVWPAQLGAFAGGRPVQVSLFGEPMQEPQQPVPATGSRAAAARPSPPSPWAVAS